MTVRQLPESVTFGGLGSAVSGRLVVIGMTMIASFGLLVARLGVTAVPVVAIAALVVVAALVDESTCRIPNRIVLAGLVLVAVGVATVASARAESTGSVVEQV
jgi:uncharacterized membrane protein YdcZ (DUF606 family)